MKVTTRKIGLLVSYLLVCGVQSVSACSPDDYMGSICLVAGSFCPSNTLEANGQAVSISSNPALYSLLGTMYGSTTTTFNLPNLQGRSPVGITTVGAPAGTLTVTQGQTVGNATNTLSTTQLPAHTHTFTPTGSTALTAILQASTSQGVSNTPSATNQYLSVAPSLVSSSGSGVIKLWGNTLSNPVPVGGLSVAATGTSGSIGVTGNSAPVTTQSPALGLRYCVVSSGLYPSKP